MQYQEYQIVSRVSLPALNQEVSKFLKAGWELYDSPIITITKGGVIIYSQAIVKK